MLRRALNFAVDWRLIEWNPASARMRTARRRRPGNEKAERIGFFTPSEAKEFLDAVRGDPYQALFVTALTTGARPSELFGLQWPDVNLESSKVTISRALHRTKRRRGEDQERWILRSTKTAGSRRTIGLPAIAVEALQQLRIEQMQSRTLAGERWIDGGFVFTSESGTPLDVSNILHRFQRICKRAGLRKLRLYELRHTHASLLIAEGVHPKLVAERLGHSSIKVTMDTYGHLFEGSDREAAGAMEKIFGLDAPDETVPSQGTATAIKSKQKSRG